MRPPKSEPVSDESLPVDEYPPLPVPAEEQENPVIAQALKELKEAVEATREINKRIEEKEKELDKRLAAPILPELSGTELELVSKRHLGKQQKMKEMLSKQPKVRIYVPLEGKEVPGTQLPVTLNGYRVNVPKGMYVDVPQQVADIIMESLNQTELATHIPQRLDLQSEERQKTLAG